MNQTQRKYLRERLSKLIQIRQENLSEKHGLERARYVNEHSFKTLIRFEQVKSGNAHFLLPKNLRESDVDQLKEYYNFDENVIKSETIKRWDKFKEDKALLEKEKQDIEDEIMLGGEKESLALLKKFENG
jgi:hypothetical protein